MKTEKYENLGDFDSRFSGSGTVMIYETEEEWRKAMLEMPLTGLTNSKKRFVVIKDKKAP